MEDDNSDIVVASGLHSVVNKSRLSIHIFILLTDINAHHLCMHHFSFEKRKQLSQRELPPWLVLTSFLQAVFANCMASSQSAD